MEKNNNNNGNTWNFSSILFESIRKLYFSCDSIGLKKKKKDFKDWSKYLIYRFGAKIYFKGYFTLVLLFPTESYIIQKIRS